MPTIGDRLARERKRLGMNQTEFGKHTGVGRASQVNYETDRRSPDAEYWERAAKIGVDVQYVLTGVHSRNLDQVAEEVGTYKTDKGVGALSREEEVLVELFRQLRPPDRTHAKAVISALASKGEVKGSKKTKGGAS